MNKTLLPRLSLAFAALALPLGCAKNAPPAPGQQVAAARQAPADVQASFKAKAAPNGSAKSDDFSVNAQNWEVTIQKSSLKKAFFLTSMAIESMENPQPTLLNPKIVSFDMSGSQLALFELNAGAVYDDLPGERLLQVFPILRQDDASITFSWSYGLAAISTDDMNGPAIGAMDDDPQPTLDIVATFVKDISFKQNQMILKQVVRTRANNASSTADAADSTKQDITASPGDSTQQVTFVLAPYKANPNFVPKESPREKGLGFFTRAESEKTGGNEYDLAATWDFSPAAGPVTWAIARNTPTEVADAMEKGIKYWNTVAGREIFKVERNADPDEVPSARRATISYAFDNADGSAFANLASDPLTGEIRSALVHVSSGWYEGLPPSFPTTFEPGNPVAAPKGFKSQHLCQLQNIGTRGLVRDMQAKQAGDPAIHRALLDIMTMVVAHEVGHTIGLRHNFSASLFSKIPGPMEREAAFADYLAHPDSPGAEVSSSVMDYFAVESDALGGAFIQKHPLAYDLMAFRWAYDPANAPSDADLAKTVFCTDEDAEKNLVGCRRFDSGTTNSILAQAQDTQLFFKQLPRAAIFDLLTLVLPGYGRPHGDLNLISDEINPQTTQSYWLNRAALDAAAGMRASAVDVKVSKGDLLASWLSGASKEKANGESLTRMSLEVGGVPGAIRTSLGLAADAPMPNGWLKPAVVAELAKVDFSHAYGADGKQYALSAAEVKQLRDIAPLYGEALESAVTRDTLLIFTGFSVKNSMAKDGKPDLAAYMKYDDVPGYNPALVTADWSAKLGALAQDIITRQSGTHEVTVNGAKVTVIDYAFRQDVRVAAARFLAPAVFSQPASANWAADNTKAIQAALGDNLKKIATVNKDNTANLLDAEADSDLRAYFLKEQAVFKAIDKASSAAKD